MQSEKAYPISLQIPISDPSQPNKLVARADLPPPPLPFSKIRETAYLRM